VILHGRRTICVASTVTRDNQYDNRITDKGALALAEALRANSSLQWLDLVRYALCYLFLLYLHTLNLALQGRNRMTDKGALALAEALQVNSSLQELELVSLSAHFLYIRYAQ